MTISVIDYRECQGIRVELVCTPDTGNSPPWAPEEPEGDVWGVQLRSGGDSELEVLSDEWKARAHFREVCLKALGITVPYQAPALANGGFAGPGEGKFVTDAATAFYHYHGRLKRCSVGSEEAMVVRDEAMADPEFIRNAKEIFDLVPNTGDWVSATLRVVCKRIWNREAVAAQEEAVVAYENNPTFGMF